MNKLINKFLNDASSTISNFDIQNVLRELAREFSSTEKAVFENVLIVGMQHILQTTCDMLSVLKEYGLKHAIIGGKKYSTHHESAKKIEELGFTYIHDGYQLGFGLFDVCMQEVVHRIWFKALEKIESKKFDLVIVLDDGADLLRATPGAFFNGFASSTIKNKPGMIIGIEQTRGGTNLPLFNGLPFPIINVAGSLAKTRLEYPKVAENVAKKVLSLIYDAIKINITSTPVIGVLGYGTMGKAMVKRFIEEGFLVIVYEKNPLKRESDDSSEVIHFEHSAVMIANADIIIGCTGEDITADPINLAALLYSKDKKLLISAGSKDYEFNTLLVTAQNEIKNLGYMPDPLQTIHYENHLGVILEIIRGGFPINFTNEAHSILPEYIWPTRAALMLACFSAVYMRRTHFDKYTPNVNTFMLSSDIQALILNKYCELNPTEKDLVELCLLSHNELINFITQHSDGAPIHDGKEGYRLP